MNVAFRADHSSEQVHAAAPEVDGELNKIVPLERTLTEKFRSETREDAKEVSTLISRIAATSVTEVDNLLDELRTLRNYLQAEGERVEREAARYAQVSETALASVRIIIDSMGGWRGDERALPK